MPKTVEAAQIAAQAAAFFEMLNPDTMLNVSEGDAGAQASLGQFVQNAYKGQEMTLLTGQDGQWVLLNPEGRVTAVSNRNRPLREIENEPDLIIRPLE